MGNEHFPGSILDKLPPDTTIISIGSSGNGLEGRIGSVPIVRFGPEGLERINPLERLIPPSPKPPLPDIPPDGPNVPKPDGTQNNSSLSPEQSGGDTTQQTSYDNDQSGADAAYSYGPMNMAMSEAGTPSLGTLLGSDQEFAA